MSLAVIFPLDKGLDHLEVVLTVIITAEATIDVILLALLR